MPSFRRIKASGGCSGAPDNTFENDCDDEFYQSHDQKICGKRIAFNTVTSFIFAHYISSCSR